MSELYLQLKKNLEQTREIFTTQDFDIVQNLIKDYLESKEITPDEYDLLQKSLQKLYFQPSHKVKSLFEIEEDKLYKFLIDSTKKYTNRYQLYKDKDKKDFEDFKFKLKSLWTKYRNEDMITLNEYSKLFLLLQYPETVSTPRVKSELEKLKKQLDSKPGTNEITKIKDTWMGAERAGKLDIKEVYTLLQSLNELVDNKTEYVWQEKRSKKGIAPIFHYGQGRRRKTQKRKRLSRRKKLSKRKKPSKRKKLTNRRTSMRKSRKRSKR